jgi:hypothetical protein
VIAACNGRTTPATVEESQPSSVRNASVTDAAVAAPPVHGDDLEPGNLRAFGLLMPVGTNEQFANDSTKIFYVQGSLTRVMRYLERRLDIPNAEIHPLGAMIRNAHVRTTPDGENRFVDVGLRDENDRTMVTVWNRSSLPVAPRTTAEGLRAAGFDPHGRPLPQNNN